MTFDPQKDFVPIGLMVYVPYLLVVHPSLPVKNVKEFVALAKAHPGKLNFASPGVGTPNHLGIELLSMVSGVKFVHVPYKGGALAVTDLVAGQVQAFFSGTPQVSAFTRTGRLKVIAVGTQKPTKVAPEYAPIADTYPGFDCNTWFGIARARRDAAGHRRPAQHRTEQGPRSRPDRPAAVDRAGRRGHAGLAGRAAAADRYRDGAVEQGDQERGHYGGGRSVSGRPGKRFLT